MTNVDYRICGCDYCRATFRELVETGLAWVLGREPNESELDRNERSGGGIQ